MTHLSDRELAAHLDGTLDPLDHERITAHLAECPTCRTEMVEVRRVLRRSPSPRSRARFAIPLAAAAVVAALVLLPSGGEDTVEPLRSDTAAGLVRVEVETPVMGDTPSGRRVTLRWAPLGERLDYRVTVTDGTGSPVWEGVTSADSLVLSPEVLPPEPAAAYWFVDVTLPSGEVASSGIQELRTP